MMFLLRPDTRNFRSIDDFSYRNFGVFQRPARFPPCGRSLHLGRQRSERARLAGWCAGVGRRSFASSASSSPWRERRDSLEESRRSRTTALGRPDGAMLANTARSEPDKRPLTDSACLTTNIPTLCLISIPDIARRFASNSHFSIGVHRRFNIPSASPDAEGNSGTI
jgi:hypothetical protein